MKIVEQYFHETGRRMPARGKTETMEELRSLLLDEIEKRFGPEPTEEQAKEVLAGFGPPADVAKQDGGDVQVIAPALADLYFLILKIILGAMAVAFTTVFIVEAATGAIGEAEFWGARLDDEWTPDELDGVIVTLAENAFLRSTLTLGQRAQFVVESVCSNRVYIPGMIARKLPTHKTFFGSGTAVSGHRSLATIDAPLATRLRRDHPESGRGIDGHGTRIAPSSPVNPSQVAPGGVRR